MRDRLGLISRLVAATATILMLFSLSIIFRCYCGVASATIETFAPGQTRLYDLEALRLATHIANALYPLGRAYFDRKNGEADVRVMELRMTRLATVGGRIGIANRAWFTPRFAPSAPVLEVTRKIFDITTTLVAFNAQTGHDIRSWLGPGAPIIPISPETNYIIANRSLFSDPWVYGFDVNKTIKRDFFGLSAVTSVPFMTNPLAFVQYEHSLDGEHIRIPLRGQIAFWMFEPKRAALLTEPITAWINRTYQPQVMAIAPRKCFLSFPRFSARDLGATDLIPIMRSLAKDRALAMPLMRASEQPTGIVQSSVINVNERGVSTSSITAIYNERIRLKVTPVIIDRPFAFAIVDEQDKRILFAGSITNF